MKPENISARLRFILSLSERWERNGVIDDIDRDVILEYLRGIYSEVSASAAARFQDAHHCTAAVEETGEETVEDKPAETPPATEPPAEPDAEDDDVVLDDDILSVAVDEDMESETDATPEAHEVSDSEPAAVSETEPTAAETAVPESEPDAAETPEAEQAAQPEAEAAAEPKRQPESAAEPAETVSRASYEVGSLFDLGGVDRSRKRSIVMSLYGDSSAAPRPRHVGRPAPEPKSASAAEAQPEPVAASEPAETAWEEPAPKPQPEAEPQPGKRDTAVATPAGGKPAAVLGEVIVSGVKTVADVAPRVERVAESLPVTDLHTAINLNDKFTMIRDLFGGDVESYNRTVSRLNGMRSLDEALFYIGKNFAWKAESEGARLLMDVLQRRYGR